MRTKTSRESLLSGYAWEENRQHTMCKRIKPPSHAITSVLAKAGPFFVAPSPAMPELGNAKIAYAQNSTYVRAESRAIF
jgi:hypothetical protein